MDDTDASLAVADLVSVSSMPNSWVITDLGTLGAIKATMYAAEAATLQQPSAVTLPS